MGLIYLDSCLLIYLGERHARWGDEVRGAIINTTGTEFAISPLVKLECLVGPGKRSDPVLRQIFNILFEEFRPLGIPEQVYIDAAELLARFGLRTPDALHLACAQHHRCEALWTNDDRLAQASHGLARNVLR